MMRSVVRVGLGLVVALAAGCPVPVGPPQAKCPDWGCGSNAANMGQGLSFHELDASGVNANSAGIKYKSFADAAGNPLTLEVVGHELSGTDKSGTVLRRAALVGAMLELEQAGQPYPVRIRAVGQVDFWVAPREPIPTYTFEYRPPGGDFTTLCKATTLSSEWKGTAVQLALVFQGDRYDAAKKTVIATGTAVDAWFNIACAGTAVAKMHLLRHTDAGSTGPYQTTPDQRQAMLKMVTDDICGTGQSFTVDGEEVYYTDQRGWYGWPFSAVPATYESIWTPKGALCLNEPRRLKEDATVGPAVAGACPALPPCQPLLANWQASGYGLSANP